MPPLVCVMGVSAAGKSTVGAAVAEALGVPFVDADALHPDENRARMAAGIALTDDERWRWLDDVGATFADHRDTGLVAACSALRRAYRDRIRSRVPEVVFVHLDGPRDLLVERAEGRSGHFMPAVLLGSQLAILEPLADDEQGLTTDVSLTVDELVTDITTRLSRP